MRYQAWIRAAKTCLFAFMVGGFFACGSHNTGGNDMSGGPDSGSGSLDAPCTAWATAYCAQLQMCNPHQFSVDFKDASDCAARQKLTCTPLAGLAGSTLTASNLMACAQALSGIACNDFLTTSNLFPTACHYSGTLAAMAKCGDDSQCASGSCKASMNSGCGTCVPRLAANSTCTGNADCAYGLECYGNIGSRKCVTPADSTGACSATIPCKAGLYCTANKCAAQLGASATCTATGGECDSTKGLYCNPMNLKCTTYMSGQVGAQCGQVGNNRVECVGGAGCYGMNLMMRTCVAPAADGAACNASLMSSGPGCQTNASCVGAMPPMGTCTSFNPAVCK